MDRQPLLEGERLRLRPLAASDWDALFAVASDREIWAQHPASDRWQEVVFRAFFDEALDEGGAMVAIENVSGKIVGSSQFRPCPLDNSEMEIGWTFLAREQWGGAINREMKGLMLGHALEDVPRVLFRIGDTNWRSRKAMEKIGGMLVDGMLEQGEYKGQAVTHVVYEITREAFASGPLRNS